MSQQIVQGAGRFPAFLAHGETTASEKYGETVEKAIRYLCAKQNDKGEFAKITPNGAAPVYTQAICGCAISEAYGMTRIGSLKEVMEKGVQVIINGQQPKGGFDYGWKKNPAATPPSAAGAARP